MSALHNLQEGFARAIFGDEIPDRFMACVDTRQAEKARAGVAAYRRSVLANLAGAVQSSYPVVQAIVGDDFMAAACRQFAEIYPSKSGDLNLYGSEFATFLEEFEPAAALPYLPDVARLEWLVQRVSGAEDAPEMNLQRMSETPADQWGGLRFHIDPAHALFASKWPVVSVWEVNQPEYAGDFQVDFERGQCALVHRRTQGIAVACIGDAESAFLDALASNCTLDEAVSRACAADENFDLSTMLQRVINNGLLRRAT